MYSRATRPSWPLICLLILVLLVAFFISLLMITFSQGPTTQRVITYTKAEVFQIQKSIPESKVNCIHGIPCIYPEEVDFRIIVITFNRASSLMRLLKSLDKVELDGDSARMEIWVDRGTDGSLDPVTLEALVGYKWAKGPSRIHIQKKNAGIMGQWINTYSPINITKNAREIAVILEDDISVSPYIYRWLRAVHRHYANDPNFVGATLNSDERRAMVANHSYLVAPKDETTYFYKCIGTWGMSTTAYHWYRFQDWFHNVARPNKFFRPYIEGIAPTAWYKDFEKSGTEHTMWEMWLLYYTYKEKVFTLYNNIPDFVGNNKSCLSINHREIGLHSGEKGKEDYCSLLNYWSDTFVEFPTKTTMLDWDGKVISSYG